MLPFLFSPKSFRFPAPHWSAPAGRRGMHSVLFLRVKRFLVVLFLLLIFVLLVLVLLLVFLIEIRFHVHYTSFRH